ncbi:MAG: hypothetical protein GY772_29055 [bacterium]|nr:hypothetical protein [bacterium]
MVDVVDLIPQDELPVEFYLELHVRIDADGVGVAIVSVSAPGGGGDEGEISRVADEIVPLLPALELDLDEGVPFQRETPAPLVLDFLAPRLSPLPVKADCK